MKTGKIYIAEIVTSTLKTDGKWHLSSEIKAFAEKSAAIRCVDSWNESLRGSNSMRFKFGTVHEIEEVME